MSSNFAFIGLCALAATVGFFLRGFIRRSAPYYEPSAILIAGLSAGLGLALFLSLLAIGTDLAGWRLAVVHAFAILALAFIAVEPEAVDWANKTRQVSIVAMLSYAGASFAIFLFVFGSYLL